MSYLKDVIVKGYANSILDHEYLQFLNLSGVTYWKQGILVKCNCGRYR